MSLPAKTLLSTRTAPPRHWVGDGFPVHGLFDYGAGAAGRSPFLLLDYAAPTRFEPTTARRGVGAHPHRGFETVTIVYAGEVEHRDSTGQGGVIGPGDVQWMTAGGGIVHEEFHAPGYARQGGPFEMVQLWVNLPAAHKRVPAAYQAIRAADIPVLPLPAAAPGAAVPAPASAPAGELRLIAGRGPDGVARGPAHTFTPMNVWDLRLRPGQVVDLAQPEGWPVQLVVLAGELRVNGQAVVGPAGLASLSAAGQALQVEVLGDAEAKLLLLAGEPIDEPVVGHGPFVMNSPAEIVQAIEDLRRGRFGTLPA